MSNRRRHEGFGVLEMLTTLAFLVIMLGLMVSLARYVRATSADRITQQVLRQLDMAIQSNSAQPPDLPADVKLPSVGASEATWSDYAQQSGLIVQQLLKVDEAVSDAWGRPIAYLPFERMEIGMAPHNRPFCVSPGPDGRFLTQGDNLYSYDQSSSAFPPASWPAAGHRE